MDHLTEAKKFIERAQNASHREVINQHLVMADWYLTEAIKERDGTPGDEKRRSNESLPGPGAASAQG